jgi:hypothetical protein
MTTIPERLNQIVPGETYPIYVRISERGVIIEFTLVALYLGTCCNAHVNGFFAFQFTDRNNSTICANLKRDLEFALLRGAEIEIGDLHKCANVIDRLS